MTGAPPSSAGAVQATIRNSLPSVSTVKPVGAPGAVAGVAASEAALAAPSPTELTARSLNAYSVPLVRPVAVQAVVKASLPGMAVHWP